MNTFTRDLYLKDKDLHACTAKRRGISLNSTGVNLLLQQLSAATTPESWLNCRCSLTTVGRQSKQCDGKYSGPLHPSHNTSSHESARARFASHSCAGKCAARSWCSFVPEQRFSLLTVTWLREMLSWAELHCTRTKNAFNTFTVLYVSC